MTPQPFHYNPKDNTVSEKPRIAEPTDMYMGDQYYGAAMDEYHKHLKSLRTYTLVPERFLGSEEREVVEGKDFVIDRGEQISSTDQQQWQEMSRSEKDGYFKMVAIPPAPSQRPSVEKEAEAAAKKEGVISGPPLGYYVNGYIAGHTSRASEIQNKDMQIAGLRQDSEVMSSEIQALQKEVEGLKKDIIHLNGQCDLRDGLIQQLQQANAEFRGYLEQILNSPHPCNEFEFHSWHDTARQLCSEALTPLTNKTDNK